MPAIVLATAMLLGLAASACGGGDDAALPSPTPTIISARTSPSGVPTGISGAAGTSAPAASGTVPADCESVVPATEITALVGTSLVAVPSTPEASGTAKQIVCRYLLAQGAPADRSVLLVVAGYQDAQTAAFQDAKSRTGLESQGGSFTKIEGVGEDGYSFVVPAWSGISTRLGSHTVSLGIGKSLNPQPSTEAVQTVVQRILSNIGP
jgi:hypothetical protein